MPSTPVSPGGLTEVKVGEGKLAITIHLEDQRTWAEPVVLQQPDLIRLSPGLTYPGGAR